MLCFANQQGIVAYATKGIIFMIHLEKPSNDSNGGACKTQVHENNVAKKRNCVCDMDRNMSYTFSKKYNAT